MVIYELIIKKCKHETEWATKERVPSINSAIRTPLPTAQPRWLVFSIRKYEGAKRPQKWRFALGGAR